jgi:hypothetical protein
MSLKVKEVVAPGIWIDTNDQLHISISDLLDEFGWPHDDEHKTFLERKVQEMVRGFNPGVKFVAQGACPNCGVGDNEKHLHGCELEKGV